MPSPYVETLLQHALDLAYSVSDATQRHLHVAEVAALAISCNHPDWAAEVLVDVQRPEDRAWLHGLMAEAAVKNRTPEQAQHHARAACAALQQPELRWHPRGPQWLTLDEARAKVCTLLGETHQRDQLVALATPISSGSAAALAARAAYVLSLRAEDDDTHDAWSKALTTCQDINDPVDRVRALTQLAAVAAARQQAIRVVSIARRPDGLLPEGTAVHRAELTAALASVLAQANHLPEASTVWAQTIEYIADPEIPLHIATALLCGIAEDQLRLLGPMIAEVTFGRAVAAVARTPLSPDPVLRFPWRRLTRTALDHPSLAAPLRDHLRSQEFLPPAWCHALGLLEQLTGNPSRARGAAKALEASHAAWPDDTESLWLAALLRCRLGESALAIGSINILLGLLPAETTVHVIDDSAGPQPLAHHLTWALLSIDATEVAADLARSVAPADLRSRLLCQVGEAERLAGDTESAAMLAREAVASRSELAPEGDVAPPIDADLAPLLCLLIDTEQPELARDTLTATLRASGETPDAIALPLLASVLSGAADTRLNESIQMHVANRVRNQPDTAHAVTLLARWIQLIADGERGG